jgi:hypothetical protein
LRAFVGIHAQIEEQRKPPSGERLSPDVESPGGLLLKENKLPVSKTYCDELAVVVDVDETLAIGMLLLAGQVRKLVIAIEML